MKGIYSSLPLPFITSLLTVSATSGEQYTAPPPPSKEEGERGESVRKVLGNGIAQYTPSMHFTYMDKAVGVSLCAFSGRNHSVGLMQLLLL